jgi:hypothetical protein
MAKRAGGGGPPGRPGAHPSMNMSQDQFAAMGDAARNDPSRTMRRGAPSMAGGHPPGQ